MTESQVGERAAPERVFERAAELLSSVTLDQPLAEAAGVLLLSPILLWLAWWNGFPFVFYDTGAYALEGLRHVFLAERSPVYSLFLDYAGAAQSFWYIVIIQALMTAYTMTEFARAEAPRLSVPILLAIGAALTLVTAIAWPVGQVEPDCMAAIVVLALYLLAFRAKELGWIRGIILGLIAGFAIGCHPSHLGLAAGLVAVLAIVRLIAWRFPSATNIPKPVVVSPSLALVLGISLVVAANAELTGQPFISRSGSVFVFSRFLQDGIVKRLLDDTCPGSGYRLCQYKDELPHRADAWLWGKGTLFNKLGRFQGTEAESGRIVRASLVRYPLMQVGTALYDTVVQFFLVRTGDGFESEKWILAKHLRPLIPGQMGAYLRARQQQSDIRFPVAINIVHLAVAYLALALLIYTVSRAVSRKDWVGLSLPGFILVALIGNAFVCGALSGPHDRYQSRLVWVPVFALILSARPWEGVALRRSIESVT